MGFPWQVINKGIRFQTSLARLLSKQKQWGKKKQQQKTQIFTIYPLNQL